MNRRSFVASLVGSMVALAMGRRKPAEPAATVAGTVDTAWRNVGKADLRADLRALAKAMDEQNIPEPSHIYCDGEWYEYGDPGLPAALQRQFRRGVWA